MAHSNLKRAKAAKNDEFYTQFQDISSEISAYVDYNPNLFRDKVVLLPCDDPDWSNFTKFFALKFQEYGIKKLISTSYAPKSKQIFLGGLFSEMERNSPHFDEQKSLTKGKIFVLERDITGDGKINIDDLEWDYLEGDGDFMSEEVTRLRDESDIIITNPPFSKFRSHFLPWVMESGKRFALLANKNCVGYKDVFTLIKSNKIWSGVRSWGGGMWFIVPENADFDKVVNGEYLKNSPSIWITNIEHGKRHEELQLMTMADNLRYNNHKGKFLEYRKYENYDAIDIPFTNVIPSDYDGVMGVPISFLDGYCPEQFEIIGLGIASLGLEAGVLPYKDEHKRYRKEIQKRGAVDGDLYFVNNNEIEVPYTRILIKKK